MLTCLAGTCSFRRMLIGLSIAPATFQRALGIKLSGIILWACPVHLENVIVSSESFHSPLIDVDIDLTIVRKAGVFLHLEKGRISTDCANYLKHFIEPERSPSTTYAS